jgi:hypothetical protein
VDGWTKGFTDDRATEVERRRELFMGGESMTRSFCETKRDEKSAERNGTETNDQATTGVMILP